MSKRVSYDVISYGEWTRPRMKDFREQWVRLGANRKTFAHLEPYRFW